MSSSSAQNQIKTDVNDLLQGTQEMRSATPEARATSLIHRFVQLCRQAASTDDMTQVRAYLNEFDKQAPQLGEAIAQPQQEQKQAGGTA